MKVLVLGGSGMLGSMVLDVFAKNRNFELAATVRADAELPVGVKQRYLDATTATVQDLTVLLDGCAWAVNCIGVIKVHIHDENSGEVERAIRVNSLFPHLLAQAGNRTNCRILQIATDCVFSGAEGRYLETSSHDPLDVYGKTKSLGEVRTQGFHNLRCSIIGPERKDKRSLLEWFLGQPKGAKVTGFLNHHWNGVTTLQFARICQGIIQGELALPALAHVVPADILSKGELLQVFATAYGRRDLTIDLQTVPQAVDRSLGTLDPVLNGTIWHAAGYPEPPRLAEMVEELAQFTNI